MIKNNFIIKTLCNFLCLFLGSIFVAACSSTSFENSINAYLTKDVEIKVPAPLFDEEYETTQLLTTNYDGKKNSLIVASTVKKDSLVMVGFTKSYLKLFTATYDRSGFKVDYAVTHSMLPPVNNVLLNVMLCASNHLKDYLPKDFKIKDTNESREIFDNFDNLIYKITYTSKQNHKLPCKIECLAFSYTISIKYLA